MAKIGIVEDEKLVAKTLQLTLESLDHEVSFISGNASDAIELTDAKRPDILLIDIQLKTGGNGISVAKKIARDIPFIFLTSQTSKTIIKEATDTTPVAYILKPFRKEEIFAALQIALGTSKNKTHIKSASIFVKEGATKVKVSIEEILYLKSDHIYVEIHQIGRKKNLVRESLNSFSEQLPVGQFVRIHQRYMVNKNNVRLVEKKQIQLTDGTVLPVSKSYVNNIDLI